MLIRFRSQSEDETIRLGEALGNVLRPGDVVALHGELGAGKTRLVRGIAVALGVPGEAVSSPTYVIAQEYELGGLGKAENLGETGESASEGGLAGRLVHVDAYRLRGEDELESVGWDRLIQPDAPGGPAPIVLIEWADRIPGVLKQGAEAAVVTMAHAGGVGSGAARHQEDEASEGRGERLISVRVPENWSRRDGFAALAALVEAVPGEEPAAGRPGRRGTRCPITGRPVSPDSPTYPFADERAKLADLNRWFTGGYTLSREITPDDESGEP